MLKKLNEIFDAKQKIKLGFIFIAILVMSGLELMGVSLILPIIQIILSTDMAGNKVYLFISELIGEDKKRTLLILLCIMAFIYVFKCALLLFIYRKEYRFVYKSERTLADRLYKVYMKQPYIYHLSTNSSKIIRTLNTDVHNFYQAVLQMLMISSEFVVGIFLVAYLFYNDFFTTIVTVIITIFCCLLHFFLVKKITIKNGKISQKNYAGMLKWVIQGFGSIKEIKISGREDFFIKKYNKNYENYAEANIRFQILSQLPKCMLEAFTISGVLMIMAARIWLGEDIYYLIPQFSVFVLAAFRLLPSVSKISAYMNTFVFFIPSINVIYEDLKEANELIGDIKEDNKEKIVLSYNHMLKFEAVDFRYPNSDSLVLQNINLEIKKGEAIGIIGESGGGKTTLVDILLGLLKPSKGSVKVDGVDIQNNLRSWSDIVGYVPQNICFIDASIRNNIAFGVDDDKIDDDKIWDVLEQVQLKEFVQSLPGQLDYLIGEDGVKLSGGQRQRLGIARTLYDDPQLIVLDEATAALDNETEEKLIQTIESLYGKKTFVIIAHRLYTLKNCDAIYKLDINGLILEKGDM